MAKITSNLDCNSQHRGRFEPSLTRDNFPRPPASSGIAQSYGKRGRSPSSSAERVAGRHIEVERATPLRQRVSGRDPGCTRLAHPRMLPPRPNRESRSHKNIRERCDVGGQGHARHHTKGSSLESPSQGFRKDGVGRSLRVPSVPPPYTGPTGSKLASAKSVDEFLLSVKLNEAGPLAQGDQPQAPRVPLHPLSISVVSPNPSLRASPAAGAGLTATPVTPAYQVHLVYRGHSLSIDLSSLPDDPAGPIILLSKTQSDPGAYLLIGAHYRRTGRSKAACSILRALLDKADRTAEQGKENAAPLDAQRSAFVTATMRPAMLMLAACELDMSRESLTAAERNGHSSVAHDLFRAVYGSANDAIIASAERPPIRNALGLDFSSNRHCSASLALDDFAPLVAVEAGRIQASRQELREVQDIQQSLPDRLDALKDQCEHIMVQLRALRTHKEDSPDQTRASEAKKTVETDGGLFVAETGALVRLKAMLSDQLGGGPRDG